MRSIYFDHVGVDIDYELQTRQVDGRRFYLTPEGYAYPSVTTITSLHGKEGILEWRKRVGEEEANRISTQAARRGTRIHTICENYLKNEDDYIKGHMPSSVALFKTVQPILDERINNIHAIEVPLYSHHLEVAGRVDCIGEFDGKLSVIDFKTSSKPKQEDWIVNYFMQCAAYAVMYEERTKIPVSRLAIVIAVENDDPQVFVKKRNDYIELFREYRKKFEEATHTF